MKLGKLAAELRPLMDETLHQLGRGSDDENALFFWRDGSKPITGDVQIQYDTERRIDFARDDDLVTIKVSKGRFEIVAPRTVAGSVDAGLINTPLVLAEAVKAGAVEADSLRVRGVGVDAYGGMGIDSDAVWFDTDRATFAFNRKITIHQDYNHTHKIEQDWFDDGGTRYAALYARGSGGGLTDGWSIQGSDHWLTDGTYGLHFTFSSEGARLAPTGSNRVIADKELWVNDGGSHYIQLKVSAGPQIITDNNYLEFKANSGGAYADLSLTSEGLTIDVTGSTISNHNVTLKRKLFVMDSSDTWAISFWADSAKSYIATNAPYSGKIIQFQADTLELAEGGRTHKIQGTSEGVTILAAGNGHTTIRNDLYIYDGTNTARLAPRSSEALRVRHPSSAYYFDIENHSEGATLDVTASSNNKHLTLKAADYYLYDASGSNYSILTAEANGFKIQPRGSGYVKIVDGSYYVQFQPNNSGVAVDVGGGASSIFYFSGDAINIQTGKEYRVNNTKVVSNRRTGWTAWTGTASRGSVATGSATLTNVAEAVKALIDDLIAHGLIGA